MLLKVAPLILIGLLPSDTTVSPAAVSSDIVISVCGFVCFGGFVKGAAEV